MGASAPDWALQGGEGQEVRLSDLWSRQPLVLVFLRHFGCIFCREQLALLRQDYPRFTDAGAQIACVGQGAPPVAKAISILLDLPFPVLTCGDDLRVFDAWGLKRAGLGQVLGLSVIVRGIGAMVHGHRQSKVVGDGLQMPGTFVVDKQGIVRFGYRSKNVADHATNEELLSLIKTLERNRSNG